MSKEYGKWKQYTIYNSDGSIEMSNLTRMKRMQGNFVVIYVTTLRKLVNDVPNFSTLKVGLFLMSKLTFSPYIAITQESIRKALKMSQSTVSNAFKWLKDNEYVKERIIDGTKCYMVNPKVALRGIKTRDDKIAHWVGVDYREESDTTTTFVTVTGENANGDTVTLSSD